MKKAKNKNLTIKILAIFIAGIMWTYVMSEVNPHTTRELKNVNLTFQNEHYVQQNGLHVMESKDIDITVKVSGRRSDVLEITDKDILAQIDLWGYSEGANRIPVDVKAPTNVEIVDVNPKNVLLTFEGIITKEVSVDVTTSGNVQPGHSVGVGEARPSAVFIKGPRSMVNSVSSVIANVDVSTFTKDIVTNVPIKVIDDRGREVSEVEKEPNTIDVNIPIYKIKTVSIDPQIGGEVLAGYEVTNISSKPTTVEIRGYEEVLRNITSVKTTPLDVNLASENKEGQVQIELPDGVELIDRNLNPTVTARVEEIVDKTLEYDFNDLSINNLDDELLLESVEEELSAAVTIRGVKSDINNFNKDQISLNVDLTDLGEGEHLVTINYVILDNNIDMVSVDPKSIRLTLKKKGE